MIRRADRAEAKRPFLTRLARDARGNVLAIVGASLLPLLAMVGSGIDLTRAYMAQARLQQACDAAALAGRRVMTGGVVGPAVTSEATKFFNFNFPQQTWGTTAFTPAISQGADSTVVIAASTTIPTQIMRLFGFNTLSLDVTCNAKQDFVNTDIVLVLDTTGSMDQDVNGNDVNGGPTSKIVALRAAVLALYDQLSSVQTRLEGAGLRLRYGIVPFSSGVNVGKILYTMNPSYIASDNWTYQSRDVTTSSASQTGCQYSGRDYNRDTGVCSNVTYRQKSIDISNFVAGGTVNVTPIVGPEDLGTTAARNTTWKGCIEERQTVNTITSSSGYTIPDAAMDLDIDLIPTGDKATKWKPYWPEVEYDPYYKRQPQVACPTEARRLQAWTRAALSTYLDGLAPDGGTYHDNGMIWGARFIAQVGIFSADNPTTYGNMPVSRHVIYMTDGIIDTGAHIYTTYGLEGYDRRVGGYTGSAPWPNSPSNDADSDSRHDQRFKMMCAATKQMGVSIWIIAFASTLTDSLSSCATSPSQASVSSNSAQLTAKFVEIGKSIGALRLTQ